MVSALCLCSITARAAARVVVLARILACRARAEADRPYALTAMVHDHAGVEVSLELDPLIAPTGMAAMKAASISSAWPSRPPSI
jgi:hypothetical protein